MTSHQSDAGSSRSPRQRPTGRRWPGFRTIFSGVLGIVWCLAASAGPAASVPADTRLAVPGSIERAEAAKLVHELFGPELDKAASDADRKQIAEKLMAFSADEADPVNRFVLLDYARRTAVDAGDWETALAAVDRLAELYRIERAAVAFATLQSLSESASSPAQHELVAHTASAMMDQAIDEEQLDSATSLGALALQAAKDARQSELVRELVERGKELAALRESFAAIERARAVLLDDPTDADANLAVGRYLSFVKDDWNGGIPMLALGSDDRLRSVAELELGQPATPDAQVAVADAWWEQSEALDGSHREVVQSRAVMWYRRVEPQLAGLSKLRVSKRLAEVADRVADAAGDPDPAGEPRRGRLRSSARIRSALIERVAGQVKQKQTSRTQELGFPWGKAEFTAVPSEGGILVGFDVSLNGSNKITALRPIFHTAEGEVAGPFYGAPTKRTARFVARKGFAVGALTIRPGFGIDGMGITFLEITETGLDPNQGYQSPWLGSGRGNRRSLGGGTTPVVGIFGHQGGGKLTALGLVQVALPEATVPGPE